MAKTAEEVADEMAVEFIQGFTKIPIDSPAHRWLVSRIKEKLDAAYISGATAMQTACLAKCGGATAREDIRAINPGYIVSKIFEAGR